MTDPNYEHDYKGKCKICGASPIVPILKMCTSCISKEVEAIKKRTERTVWPVSEEDDR